MSQVMSNKDVLAFFHDPDSSSVISAAAHQITAPMLQGMAITNEEMMMGGGVRVVFYIFDRSPSMKPVSNMLMMGCNEDMVPAIKAAREDDISTLRLGGLSFSSDITRIWADTSSGSDTVYFHTLDNLPPLTKAEYDPDKGCGTALHKAIIEGTALAIAYANTIKQQTGMIPEIDIIVLSDGANNENPLDTVSVYKAIKGARKDLVRFSFFYFETDWGLPDPAGYAQDLGFDPENVMTFEQKPGESKKEYASRFRRMFRVMSRVSASKGTSAVQAAAAVQAQRSDEEEDDLM